MKWNLQPLFNFIERYRIYLIIPIFLFLNQIDFIHFTGDVKAFYLGSVNIFQDPIHTYDIYYYFANDAYHFLYLPFFGTVFYPLTLWGYEFFANAFFLIGVFLFIINIFLWDAIMRSFELHLRSRFIYLILMTIGRYYYSNIMTNQSKIYVVFLITLIIYGINKNWNKIIIHILFSLFISMMLYLFFIYLYYIIKQSRVYDTSINKKHEIPKFELNLKIKWQNLKNELSFKLLLKNLVIAGLILFISNIMFFINYQMIDGFIDYVIINYIQNSVYIVVRVFDSVIAYLMYTYLGFRQEIFTIYLIILILGFFLMILLDTSIIGAVMVNLVIMIGFNPSNEQFYFIFIYPTILLWLSHNIFHEEKKHTLIDISIHISFYFIIKYLFYYSFSVVNVFLNGFFVILIFGDFFMYSTLIKKE